MAILSEFEYNNKSKYVYAKIDPYKTLEEFMDVIPIEKAVSIIKDMYEIHINTKDLYDYYLHTIIDTLLKENTKIKAIYLDNYRFDIIPENVEILIIDIDGDGSIVFVKEYPQNSITTYYSDFYTLDDVVIALTQFPTTAITKEGKELFINLVNYAHDYYDVIGDDGTITSLDEFLKKYNIVDIKV